MTFSDLGLFEPILRAVAAEGYSTPTAIQRDAIPHILAGRDLLGTAQTGTGKTAAFTLPLLDRLRRPSSAPQGNAKRPAIRSLILCPTRELAAQISESVAAYGRFLGLRQHAIFGGVNQFHQVRALRRGLDTLIATPGRLLDLVNQGHIDLSGIEILVLDEADRMLDMGFLPDLKRILKLLPAKRQNLLFSATMPEEIRSLADGLLRDPVRINATPKSMAAPKIDQSVCFVKKNDKPAMLKEVLNLDAVSRALVFARTKHGADRVVKDLERSGIRAVAIHGNKSQAARTKALASFRSAEPPVLVATDLASRGIDVDGISHVINFDIPDLPETYLHRIGRTARAGATGIAISLCDRSQERGSWRAIEKSVGAPIRVLPALDADGVVQDADTAMTGVDQALSSADRPSRAERQPSQRQQTPSGTKRKPAWQKRKPAGKPRKPSTGWNAAEARGEGRGQPAHRSAAPTNHPPQGSHGPNHQGKRRHPGDGAPAASGQRKFGKKRFKHARRGSTAA